MTIESENPEISTFDTTAIFLHPCNMKKKDTKQKKLIIFYLRNSLFITFYTIKKHHRHPFIAISNCHQQQDIIYIVHFCLSTLQNLLFEIFMLCNSDTNIVYW